MQLNFFYFAGTPPFEKLTELLTKISLIKDVRQMSGQHATSSLEAFHSVQNHFAPKRLCKQVVHNRTLQLALGVNRQIKRS